MYRAMLLQKENFYKGIHTCIKPVLENGQIVIKTVNPHNSAVYRILSMNDFIKTFDEFAYSLAAH